MKHQIRQAYGFTDEQIYEHIATDGEDWAIEAYEFIMEDRNTYWQMMTAVLPVARTPMDKKGGKALQRYTKQLRLALEKSFAPWINQRRIAKIKARLAKPPKGVVYDENGNVINTNDPDWWKKLV